MANKMIVNEAITQQNMTQICKRVVHVNIKFCLLDRVSIFRRFFRFIWDRILVCSVGGGGKTSNNSVRYMKLNHQPLPSPEVMIEEGGGGVTEELTRTLSCSGYETDSDLVPLKISLLGDCQTGKTSFVIKYVGDEQEKYLQMTGLNLINKTLLVQGARISFSIWDVGGDSSSYDHVPIACKDAVAIFFMFDLTSRCTLNSVVEWYSEARKWNQAAIPIIIGTKFDDFVRLPPDLQWTIVTQARAYARAMKATLFFSSAKHNINVNKIFKFIMAKLFNLPWTVERNLTIGEPIIDF
ncbi:hypothetical protein LWI28_020124 [Acer negundo]|uniref:Septum-promoting GTP-binding protein 1 n=1 Tax=Acer negundo TaxID=4023 RepID=A0AAD5J716_ACENE|nr:hypothetical protein LWI28_020124 [Acer negundo]